MTDLYPEIKPYDHGMLEVGDGDLVFWETCGRNWPVVTPHREGACSVAHELPLSRCRRRSSSATLRFLLSGLRSHSARAASSCSATSFCSSARGAFTTVLQSDSTRLHPTRVGSSEAPEISGPMTPDCVS